jgi:X-X-X-Leu-X-X-Gly heptad repeat protein
MVARRASSAVTVSIPSACRTPAPPGGLVPIPFPNFATTAVKSQREASSGTQQKTPVGAPAPLGTPAPASIRPGEISIKLGSSSLRVARSGEILQLHNGLNQLNSKLQSLATDDPDEWQRVVQDYVVMASALYVTLNDDGS